MSIARTIDSDGAVRTWTGFVSRCRACGLDFRVSAEAIEETRREDGPEAAHDSDGAVANRIEFCLLCALGAVAAGEKPLEDGWRFPHAVRVDHEDTGSWSVVYDHPRQGLTRVREGLSSAAEAARYAAVIAGTWRFCPPAGLWLTLHGGAVWSTEDALPDVEPDLGQAERRTIGDWQEGGLAGAIGGNGSDLQAAVLSWVEQTWPSAPIDGFTLGDRTPTLAGLAPPIPRFIREFPRFTADDIPALPPDFADESWHDDACPRFYSAARDVTLWVAHPDPQQREDPGFSRFVLHRGDVGEDDDGETLAATERWSEVVAAMPPVPRRRRFRVYRADVRFSELDARSAAEAVRLSDSGPRRWSIHGELAAALPVTGSRDHREVRLVAAPPTRPD